MASVANFVHREPWKSRSRLKFDPGCGRPVGDQQNSYRTAKPPVGAFSAHTP